MKKSEQVFLPVEILHGMLGKEKDSSLRIIHLVRMQNVPKN